MIPPLDCKSKIVYSETMNIEKTLLFKWLKKGAIIMALVIFVFILALVIFYLWAGSGTIPEAQLSQRFTYPNPKPLTTIEPETISLMTYNIGYLSGMTNNKPMKPDKAFFQKNMTTFVDYLKVNPPHIIGFQEIDYHSKRSSYIDQLQTIGETAGYLNGLKGVNWDKRYVPFPYGSPSTHFGPVVSGQAILSRFPIIEDKRIVLPKPESTAFYYNHFYLDRLLQVAKIKIGNNTIVVINVHLEAFEVSTREEHTRMLLETYRFYKDKFPVLLIGDFNSLPPDTKQKKGFGDEMEADFTNDKTIAMVLAEKSLKSAFLESGAYEGVNFTFPADKPTRKLDYIFYTHKTITVTHVELIHIDSSDHLPILVHFKLVP
jgi:endonuclease/exonuclease/phosphatase family metal-dependent hydrolase